MISLIKRLVKKIAFKMFPHIQYYNDRISNIEAAITAIAKNPAYTLDTNALNQQVRRKEVVADILLKLTPHNIIETGTHLGDSTGYFAKFAKNIYTSDISPIYMWAAKSRLSHISNIHYFIGDSRDFLLNLAENDALSKNKATFFYLDAHWHEDLPLHEEIRLITENWSFGHWIILIDDFCVPNDDGYGYPSYGPNKTLNFSYIKDLVDENKLEVFFPTVPSEVETGYKTGYVFISNGGDCSEILKNNSSLKQAC